MSLAQARQMVLHVSEIMVASRDLLTQADKAIGDGDHGIGMSRGFEAVAQKVATASYEDLRDLFSATGMALLTSVGGAAGAVFGTLFRGGAKGLRGQDAFDTPALAVLLRDGFRAVQERGGARPGDKTMLDALGPAVAAVEALTDAGIADALVVAAAAARQGVEQTKDMVARIGKAKALGSRALGHADPGAISLTLILEAMAEYAKGL
jgi:dihydroxyacetone kinase-like protein